MHAYYSYRNHFVTGGFFLGAELPVGLAFQFKFPLEVAVEAMPLLAVADHDGFFLGLGFAAALHVRYYF